MDKINFHLPISEEFVHTSCAVSGTGLRDPTLSVTLLATSASSWAANFFLCYKLNAKFILQMPSRVKNSRSHGWHQCARHLTSRWGWSHSACSGPGLPSLPLSHQPLCSHLNPPKCTSQMHFLPWLQTTARQADSSLSQIKNTPPKCQALFYHLRNRFSRYQVANDFSSFDSKCEGSTATSIPVTLGDWFIPAEAILSQARGQEGVHLHHGRSANGSMLLSSNTSALNL